MNSMVRVVLGFAWLAVSAVVWAVVLVAAAPFRGVRIRLCNHYGHVTGPLITRLAGARVVVEGREHLDPEHPTIYVSNHTSILDIFLGIWLAPMGTVGVAKKEVVYYPFFGQLYWLSGHLRLDRGDRQRAIAAMKELEAIVRRHRLSIWMWPEGTRSRDGRLRPFKKGLYHLGVGTGLTVTPVVVVGAQDNWEKGGLRLKPCAIHVHVLPPIDTSDWASRDRDEVLAEVHRAFVDVLPAGQQPAEDDAAA